MNVPLHPFEATPPGRSEAVNSFIAQLWRRRRLFGLIFAAVFLPSIAAIMLLTPVYLATGTVLIGNQEPTSSGASAAWIEKLGDPADLESQLLIITSRRMLRLALARPGVVDAVLEECRYRSKLDRIFLRAPDCGDLSPDSDELLDYVATRYSVGGVGRSRIIAINYRSPVPDVALILANSLLITYLEDQRAENARSREAASAWLLREGSKTNRFENPRAEQHEATQPTAGTAESRSKFYQDLYRKTSDLESERRSLLNSARLVSLAEVPRLPYFPKRLPLLAAVITIAVVLAILGALRQDMTDRTIRRTGEFEAHARRPVLGILPVGSASGDGKAAAIWKGRFASRQIVTPDDAARALYARLLLSADGKAPRSILVSSCSREEGKTTATIAIGRSAAESGRKVLIIDCNLGRPAVSSTIGVAFEVGLTDVLRGGEPQRAVVHSPHPGLDIIAAGSGPRDTSMVLADDDLAGLMNWAKRYDLVLLDGPASDSLLDTAILARCADGVLWCARWGSTLQSDVVRCLDDLRQHRSKVLGLIITADDLREVRLYDRPHMPAPLHLESV
jgi:Mrp family chromosome partitioning ATPase